MTIMDSLPQSFVWTRLGTEAGQTIAQILRRKEIERLCGDGVFAWGIGNALGSAVANLMSTDASAEVIFSPMISKAKQIDTQPGAVALWTAYIDASGHAVQIADHICITSRYSEGKRAYALFCSSSVSLSLAIDSPLIDGDSLSNLGTGSPVGASQVTAVVRRSLTVAGGRLYAVAMRARLHGVGFARLCNPVLLTQESVEKMEQASQDGVSAWGASLAGLRAKASERSFALVA